MPGSNPRGRSGLMGPAHKAGLVFRSPRHRLEVRIEGVTRDSTGALLAGCEVHLFQTIDDIEIGQATSDANGCYSFSLAMPDTNYYVVAYKAGAPDVAGITVNTVTSLVSA